MKCNVPWKGKHYLKRYAWKMLPSSKKLLVTHGKNIYWENYLVIQLEILCQVFKSEIVWCHRVMNKEKIFRRKYSVDTLTDTGIVDFECASLSSQSKKESDTSIRGRQTYCLFSLCYIVQFCWCWFSLQTVSVNLRDLCQIWLQ